MTKKLEKQVTRAKLAQNTNHDFKEEVDNSYSTMDVSPRDEKFSQDDFVPIKDEPEHDGYSQHLKSFLNNIVNKKSENNSNNHSQKSYYETLRKINAKR
jgi:hypothetical protein